MLTHAAWRLRISAWAMSSACSSLPTDVTTTMRSLRRMEGTFHASARPVSRSMRNRVLQAHGAVRELLRGNEPQRNGPAGGLDERDSLPDQDGLDVHDDPVHLARVEEGSEERRSTDEPDVLPLFPAEPPRELLDGLLPAHELDTGPLRQSAPA